MSKAILVVDDLFTNRFLLSKLISDLDFNCVEAKNGKVAVEIIRQKKIDLVLMDIEMPVMNGIEAAKYIREDLNLSQAKLPIIAVTAHAPSDLPKGLTDGDFNGVFSKPFTVDRFKKLVLDFLH